MTDSRRIGILSVGNVLMGDDGIGPYVLKILEARYEFPANVVAHDLGTPGLGITSFFADYDAVILIDAVSAKGQPGDVRLYRKDKLVRVPIPQRVSPHDPALVEALLFAEFSGKCPQEVLLVGVVPENVELGCEITESVRAAVVPAISAILAELTRLGIEPRLRECALRPSIWWQENVSSNCPEEDDYVPGYSG
ncbi:MAG TPA: hydrogenase maturation protease [Candidatus Saccharimonadales bacterium]|nr:hydrogenase maturation protease [Candidatus Saccharimonadales bacterium]